MNKKSQQKEEQVRLPNPHTNTPFQRTYDKVVMGENGSIQQPEYGSRLVDGQEEIVHLASGNSNMSYHLPDMVLDPTGCNHEFYPVDLIKREVECLKCNLPVVFHVALNYKEIAGQGYITLQGVDYPLKA